MTFSEERKPSNVQKKICHENCQLRSSQRSESVEPCSCLVVQNSNWSESDSRKGTPSSSHATDKNRKSTTDDGKDDGATSGQRSPGSSSPGKRPSEIKIRLTGREILHSHGKTGPVEIGPGKHKQTKTSELRTQWMHGGYSLSQDSKKHLKEFNRLPFVTCGKESTCLEFISDRVQRINQGRREVANQQKEEAQIKAQMAAEQEKAKPTEAKTAPTEAQTTTTEETTTPAQTETGTTLPNADETAPATEPSPTAPAAETPAPEAPADASATAVMQNADVASIAGTEKSSPPAAGFTTGILATAFSFARPPATSQRSTVSSTADALSTPSVRSTKAAKNSRA